MNHAAQVLFYVDFKQMMTRRLAGNATASFSPTAVNTLWHDTRDPEGMPPEYSDALRSVSAEELAAGLASFGDQHAVYLNAVPLVSDADSAAVQAMLLAGFWTRGFEISNDNSLTTRVGKYVGGCGGFGMNDEELKPLLEAAAGVAKS